MPSCAGSRSEARRRSTGTRIVVSCESDTRARPRRVRRSALPTLGDLTRENPIRIVELRRVTSLTRPCAHDALSTSPASICARSSVDKPSSVPTNSALAVRSDCRSSLAAIVERWRNSSRRASAEAQEHATARRQSCFPTAP